MTKRLAPPPRTVLSRVNGDVQSDLYSKLCQTPAELADNMLRRDCVNALLVFSVRESLHWHRRPVPCS